MGTLVAVTVSMRRVRMLVLAVALLSTGCVQTETMPVLYRIPLASNAHGTEAARDCAAACGVANEGSENGFFACIGTCPDVQIVRNAECGPDPSEAPPEALCYTRLVEREVPDVATTELFIGLLGKIVEAGVRGATAGNHESRREARHAESHARHAH